MKVRRAPNNRERFSLIPPPVPPSEFILSLLKSLPLPNIANVQRKITPLLQFDLVGVRRALETWNAISALSIQMLPDELGLLVFAHLSWESLVTCSTVCKRWRRLSDDPSLWRQLCAERRWDWKDREVEAYDEDFLDGIYDDSDDEGMGDEEDGEDNDA